MKSQIWNTAALLGLLAFINGCSTAPVELQPEKITATPTAPPAPTSTADAGPVTRIGFGYSINVDDCVLRLKNLADDLHYDLPLNPQENVALFEVPDGAYQGEALVCSKLRSWSLGKLIKRDIELSPGKAHFIGHFGFEYENRGNNLTVKARSAASERAAALELLDRTAARFGKNGWILAWTLKPLRKEMLEGAGASDLPLRLKFEKFETPSTEEGESTLASSGARTDAAISLLKEELTRCDAAEQRSYPLRIGRVQWQILYEQGRFKEIQRLRNLHALSDEWVRCMEAALERAQPGPREKLKVTLEL